MQTSSPRSGLAVQAPRISSLPEAFDVEASRARADEMIDLAELAGLVLDPWQALAAEGACRVRDDGKWAAFQVAVLANRQNGKGSILEARQLAGLFLWGSRLQVHTAHEFRTAQKHFERILSLIEGTPTLDRLVARVRRADGEESIETRDGCLLQFMARSLKSGRGITGDDVYLDEAFALKPQMIASLMSTMSARSVLGNPQLWFTSSAGMPESDVLWGIRRAGMEGSDPSLAYMEWSAPDDADADDPEVWAQANPALGIRISEEFVRSERATLGDEEFKRERLGIWAKLGSDPLISEAVWDGWADPDTEPGERLTFALDVPPDRASAVIGLVSWRPDGRLHLEVVDQRVGTSWVPSRLRALQERWGMDPVVVDAGGAAGSLLPDLKREGVRVREVSPREYGQACGTLFDLITDPDGSGVAHQGREAQAALAAAVEAARKKAMGDTLWKWNRRNAVSDISPLVAVTLALIGAQKTKTRPVKARRARVVVLGG